MASIKFLHCADMHLEVPFTSLDSETDKSLIRRLELKETFKEIINTALEEKVNVLLISGDLYEHNYIKKATINFINEEFGRIAPIEVFIVPGNHDPYVKNSYYKDFKWNKNVHILTEDNPYFILEDLDTCIYGVGFKSFSQEKTLVYDLKPMEAGHINILLVHGTVDMSFKQDIYNPMTSENLANLGMDYIALGHFHNRIDNVGGKGNIYNPGSPEPLGFDEKGEHGVYIGSIVKEKGEEIFLNVIFSALNRRYYEKLEINADGCNNDEQIIFRIEEALRDRDAIRGLFYIVLKGYMERGFKVNPTYIVSHFKDLVFFMKLKDETAMDYDYESIINEPGIKGLFAKKILAMLNKTEDEYEKKQLLKSLHYGIEALEHGKIEIN